MYCGFKHRFVITNWIDNFMKDKTDKKTGDLPEMNDKDKNVSPDRRKLVLGGSTVLATLASSSVLGDGRLGYICSPSGFMSGDMSGNHDMKFKCGGISPGGWWQNASKCGNQDGSLHHWVAAGCYPFPADYVIPQNPNQGSNPYVLCGVGKPSVATTFFEVFGYNPPGGSGTSLWDVLDSTPGSGTVEWHVVAGYLNAKLYKNTGTSIIASYIPPETVVAIYTGYKTGMLYEGLDAEGIHAFFNRTYH